jgi:hypothetical protein
MGSTSVEQSFLHCPRRLEGWKNLGMYEIYMVLQFNNYFYILQGRRNCNFATNPGPNSCLDGGCNGGLACDTRTGTVSFLVIPSYFSSLINNPRVFLLLPSQNGPWEVP